MSLRYTICFICHCDHVLLLHRRYRKGHTYEGRAGMYAYLAELPPGVPPEAVPGETVEGRLSWHPLPEVRSGLPGLVSNIPLSSPVRR